MEQVRVILRGVVNLRVEELNPFQDDIKILTEENYQKLKNDILADGFAFSPHVFADSEGRYWLLDGHQRHTCLTRMKEEGFEIPTIPCFEVDAESLEHARRLVLGAASQYGTFQVKKVVEFTKKLGITPAAALDRFVLPTVKFEKLVSVAGHDRVTASEEVYTKKIQAPIYEPKGHKPDLTECLSQEKSQNLCAEILEATGLTDEERRFLMAAAERHSVFNYEKIAEYYAHASPEMQALMERSALVIIDFDKAIENGFVTMTKEISEAYPNEAE